MCFLCWKGSYSLSKTNGVLWRLVLSVVDGARWTAGGGGGGVLLACEGFGRMFDHWLATCTFFLLK